MPSTHRLTCSALCTETHVYDTYGNTGYGMCTNVFMDRVIVIIFIQHPWRRYCGEKRYSLLSPGLACFYKNFLFLEIFEVFLVRYKGKTWGAHSLKLKETGKGSLQKTWICDKHGTSNDL